MHRYNDLMKQGPSALAEGVLAEVLNLHNNLQYFTATLHATRYTVCSCLLRFLCSAACSAVLLIGMLY